MQLILSGNPNLKTVGNVVYISSKYFIPYSTIHKWGAADEIERFINPDKHGGYLYDLEEVLIRAGRK